VCRSLAHSTRAWWWGCHLKPSSRMFSVGVVYPSLWRSLFTTRQVVSSLLSPRRRVASSANVAVPKVSSSADAAVEDFTVTLARGPYMVLPVETAGPRFFLRGVIPLSLTTLSWLVKGRARLVKGRARLVKGRARLVKGRARLPNIEPRLTGL